MVDLQHDGRLAAGRRTGAQLLNKIGVDQVADDVGNRGARQMGHAGDIGATNVAILEERFENQARIVIFGLLARRFLHSWLHSIAQYDIAPCRIRRLGRAT